MTMSSTAHNLRIARQLLRMTLDSAICRVYARYWGVIYGRRLKVGGLPKIRRAPGSSIKIGSDCILLSRFEYNLHGLNRPCMLSTLSKDAILTIGDNCGFSGCIIATAKEVSIGNRVMCGANVTITDTDSHSIDYKQRNPRCFGFPRDFVEEVLSEPVSIGDDVFIGMHSIVLKGVNIGDRSIIGAGSVVTRSIPEDCIAAGNPAIIRRKIVYK